MKIILFLFLIASVFSFGQKELCTLDLSDSGNRVNPTYLTQLDSIFQRSKVIGMGESTHGTSEFTIIRGDLFKYLVQNHDYSIFFLEADYNACTRLNRYIHGAKDDSIQALKEIRLWPWLTQELLDIAEWMKSYNLKHDNVLDFVGCDMQLITDDTLEFKRYLHSNRKFNAIVQQLPSLNFEKEDTALIVTKYDEWTKFSNTFLKEFPEEEPLIVNTISQWFEKELAGGYTGNFRDSCMGNNIVNYLERYPNRKGIYFAHNGHVGDITYTYDDNYPTFKRAGTFLSNRLKDQYYAIALDLNTGGFNAINFVKGKFEMEYFTLKRSKKKALARYSLNKENKIKFVSTSSIPDKNKLKINSIGAIYGKSKSGHKIYRYRKFIKDHYDAYIIINKGKPTTLLTINSKAH